MNIYVIDYDTLDIKDYPFGDVADYTQFTSEMNSEFEEWFEQEIDAKDRLHEYIMEEVGKDLPDAYWDKMCQVMQYYDVSEPIAVEILVYGFQHYLFKDEDAYNRVIDISDDNKIGIDSAIGIYLTEKNKGA